MGKRTTIHCPRGIPKMYLFELERIREIAAEMLSLQSELIPEKVKNDNETGFQTLN